MTWKDFEAECVDYLNKKFSSVAQFKHIGGSDSTKSDILVTSDSGKVFYIEAKQAPAQCGQFVLLPNIKTKKFDYSQKNMSKLNQYSQRIIDHMNRNFEEYRNSGTAGKEIVFQNCIDIFSKWIVGYYKEKNTAFIITNNFIICPIDSFSDYFSISATYRIKRSGSSPVGKSKILVILKYVQSHFKITNSITEGDKLFVKSNENLHNVRFELGDYEYMLSKREDKYEIRRLSNTYNANVIFSISLKEGVKGLSNSDFLSQLF